MAAGFDSIHSRETSTASMNVDVGEFSGALEKRSG